jgi:hypothetical protein
MKKISPPINADPAPIDADENPSIGEAFRPISPRTARQILIFSPLHGLFGVHRHGLAFIGVHRRPRLFAIQAQCPQ